VSEVVAVRYPVYHLDCGDVAFLTRRRWTPGTVMRSRDVVLNDGSLPVDGEKMRCGSCDQPIRFDPIYGAELEYRD